MPCPSLGDLSDPGTEPAFLMSLALACVFFTTNVTWEALKLYIGENYSLYNSQDTKAT